MAAKTIHMIFAMMKNPENNTEHGFLTVCKKFSCNDLSLPYNEDLIGTFKEHLVNCPMCKKMVKKTIFTEKKEEIDEDLM